MKLEVMKKEEALLEELARMNEEKAKKDEENEKLRQQLTAMKVKMEQVILPFFMFLCFHSPQFTALAGCSIDLGKLVHLI
jgi:hypothetical protein